MTKSKREKAKKVASIILNVIIYTFFVLCIFLLVASIFSKRNEDGAVNMFGYEMRIVLSGSMEKDKNTDVSGYKIKSIPVKSAIFVERVPTDEEKAEAWYAKLQVGDVLTFRYTYVRQETITHRIVDIEAKESGGYIITLEGDNKASSTNQGQQIIDTSDEYSTNYVIGKVKGQSRLLGLLVYSVKQPLGIALMIIVPCSILIVVEIIKIVDVLQAGKRAKSEEKAKAQESELEELRRRLAALEGGADAPAEDASAEPENTAKMHEEDTPAE